MTQQRRDGGERGRAKGSGTRKGTQPSGRSGGADRTRGGAGSPGRRSSGSAAAAAGRRRATGADAPKQARRTGAGADRATGGRSGRDADDRRRTAGDRGRASGERRRTTGAGPDETVPGRDRSGRARDRQARDRSGGFGPYAVDRRDEEVRERSRSGAGPRRPSSSGSSRAERPALRTVGERPTPGPKRRAATGRRTTAEPPARRRRRRGPSDVRQELGRLAGRDADRALTTLMSAAAAFAEDRERDAVRILRPLRDRLPDAPSVRELMGLAQYRVGNYGAAAKELEAYVELTDSVDQHPVLMDCYRAQRKWRRVDECWDELAAASPSAELVTEGRIVQAGSLADRGRLADALVLLRKRAGSVRSPRPHHLRLWYALADLEERAGNLARARELFDQVRRADPAFADVAERRAALG